MDLGNMTKEDYDGFVDAIKEDKGSFTASNGTTSIIDRAIANEALAIVNAKIAWYRKMIRTCPPLEDADPILIVLAEYELEMLSREKTKMVRTRNLLRNIIKDAGGPV